MSSHEEDFEMIQEIKHAKHKQPKLTSVLNKKNLDPFELDELMNAE